VQQPKINALLKALFNREQNGVTATAHFFLAEWTIAGRHSKLNWLSTNCNWNYSKVNPTSVCASCDFNYLQVKNHDFNWI